MWYLILSFLMNPNNPTMPINPVNPNTVITQTASADDADPDGDGNEMGDRGHVRPKK